MNLNKLFEMIREYAKGLSPLSILALVMLDFLEFGITATTLGLALPISTTVAVLIGIPIVFLIQILSGVNWKNSIIDTIIAGLLLAVPFPIMSVALGIIKIIEDR